MNDDSPDHVIAHAARIARGRKHHWSLIDALYYVVCWPTIVVTMLTRPPR